LSPDKDECWPPGIISSDRSCANADDVGLVRTGKNFMSEAQIGLLTATPLIMLFAGALRAMGVLSTTATVFAVALSALIAFVLFTTQ
jgi:hypothetical protein